jgi:hypothetical protein
MKRLRQPLAMLAAGGLLLAGAGWAWPGTHGQACHLSHAHSASGPEPRAPAPAPGTLHADRCRCESKADCTCKKGQCRCPKCGRHRRQVLEALRQPTGDTRPAPARLEARAGLLL